MSGLSSPPPLHGLSVVSIVAPSGPFDAALLEAGVSRLASAARARGIDLEFTFHGVTSEGENHTATSLSARRVGFFSGTDEERGRELQAAIDSEDSSLIWLARGGYGLGRLLPKLRLEPLLTRPRWFAGFSDGTALHLALAGRGLRSLHAPNATTLPIASDEDLGALLDLLTGAPRPAVTGLETLAAGIASGPLVGGNLTVLFAEAVSGRLDLGPSAVLFLEDVTETSYRVDRMLVALRDGGHLRKVSGLVFGDFTDCSPGKFNVPVANVLADFARSLGLPAVSNFPAGHGTRQTPFIHGAEVTLDAARGVLLGA